MKKYLLKVMPFWGSEVIGIISKICLTYTAMLIGVLAGLMYLISAIISIVEIIKIPTGDVLGRLFQITLLIILGVINLGHYIYAKKGFEFKNSNYLMTSHIMFGIGNLIVIFMANSLNFATILSSLIITSVMGIPLIKARKSFDIKSNI